MKLNALIKQVGLSMALVTFGISCSTPPEEVAETSTVTPATESTTSTETATQSQDNSAKIAAEAAISDAKAALSDAKTSGHEWRDTKKIIASAQKAFDAGDFDKAEKLANKATAQSNNAVAQQQGEAAKFEGATSFNENKEGSMTKPMMVSNSGDSDVEEEEVIGLTSYFVFKGDTLWGIASLENVYDNPYKWPLIYKANASIIKDADLIYPGQTFDIDQNSLLEDIDAAIDHAKHRGAWSLGEIESSDTDYLNQ